MQALIGVFCGTLLARRRRGEKGGGKGGEGKGGVGWGQGGGAKEAE